MVEKLPAPEQQPNEEAEQKKKQKKKTIKGSGDIIAIFTSITCLILIVIILYSLIMHFMTIANQKRAFTIDYEANTFLMDGKPFRYISGSIHYFRAVPAAWHKRLRSMKSAGLNAIDIYIEWSLHNPHEGVYTWSGMADIETFIKLAQREGFYVILRPGPYICAERDNGGLPYWLFRKYPNIQVRTSDANYTHEVAVWYSELMPRMQRFLYGNGGPIIMVQVENEYGSFSACDHEYMKWLRDETRKYVADNAVLFTTDYPAESLQCGSVEDVLITLDFGIDETKQLESVWNKLRTVQPTGPLVNSEFYVGWLTHWHEQNQRLDPQAVADALDSILASSNASVNLYMFFGGTNFGFTAGANDFGDSKYTPDITSYDYDALLNEWGNTTEKFDLVRQVIGRYFRLPGIKTIKEKTFSYGKVDLRPLINLLSSEGRTLLGNAETSATALKSFEALDLYSGLLLYETDLKQWNLENSLLTVNDLRDRALVYIDQEFQGILSRQKAMFSLRLNRTSGSTLQILVENQGRINYNIANDTKGIMGPVTLALANGSLINLNGWQHTAYPLADINVQNILLHSSQILPQISNLLLQGPVIYCGEFTVQKPHHTFLNPTGWGKGVAYVNGFNLGRYWPLAGPQLTLYVPQEILNRGRNTIVLVEYEQTNWAGKEMGPYITLDNKPQLDN